MKTPTTQPAIIASLKCYNSRADIYGNRYFAFRYLDHETGKVACGTVSGGESNIRSMMYEFNGGQWKENFHFTTNELPIREYNRMVKGWPHAGCRPEDLAAFVKRELAK